MVIEYLIFLVIVVVAVIASIITSKLTVAGGITGGILSILLYLGVGWIGIVLLGVFFLLGTIATSWKSSLKVGLQLTEKHSGKRTAGQVIANGGVAGLLGLVAIRFPQYEWVCSLAIAGSFSSAMADTLSSELGSIYGKRFYNILNLQKDRRGLDGVISMEGLLIGVAGSMIIAAVYSLFITWGVAFFIIVTAGTIGNLTDSLLGAAFERKGWIKNDMVNFLNTLSGALIAVAMYSSFMSGN